MLPAGDHDPPPNSGSRPGRRPHPFGRANNALVHVGATLALANGLVIGIRFGLVEFFFFPEDLGPNAGAVLGQRVVSSGLILWLGWRALMGWRARLTSVTGRLLIAGLVMMPLGPFSIGTDGVALSSAGLLLAIVAVTSRSAVLAAEQVERTPPHRRGD